MADLLGATKLRVVSPLAAFGFPRRPQNFQGRYGPCFSDLRLEAVRRSDPDMVTVLGGGYVASGEPGWDKVPVPVADLKLTPLEAAGEVQTPLTGAGDVPLGAPVLFRHAKAGELAERFNTYLLVRSGEVVGEEPTYRGEQQAFL